MYGLAPVAGEPSTLLVMVSVKATSAFSQTVLADQTTWYLQSSSSPSVPYMVSPKSPSGPRSARVERAGRPGQGVLAVVVVARGAVHGVAEILVRPGVRGGRGFRRHHVRHRG